MAKATVLEVGSVSGQLTVTEVYRGESVWRVRATCSCGNAVDVSKSNFTAGKVSTCGCGPRGKPFPKKHGLGGTPLYNSWKKMMSRCYNARDPEFKHYGARGIEVCERWHDVVNFAEDMGTRRQYFSTERIDNNLGYSPENCYWLPHKLQSKNRRPWEHTPEGLEKIAASRRKDWKSGVYAGKVAAQRK